MVGPYLLLLLINDSLIQLNPKIEFANPVQLFYNKFVKGFLFGSRELTTHG
nr:MAG TPA: hypothetical protein [Caudoviricetes sp.]